MAQARIRCIVKSDRTNPWERITHVGGLNSDGSRWKQTQEATIKDIETGRLGYYVERPAGDRVEVIVATSWLGNKYIKTKSDGDTPNNLLDLPSCP